MTAPAAAQLMMLVMMLAERRWLFAAMVAPGLVGCLAAAAMALLRRRPPAARPIDARAASEDAPEERGVDWPAPPPSLETLLGVDGPLPWRSVVRRWAAPPSMDVPLGVDARGVFRLDLAAQGPHALVAGTTGSGKSVLLQSWCLALAARNPPTRLSFVFLDFKGGSAFRPLEALPHTVGDVCDLDLGHATRALRALEGELRRRERLVAEAGVPSAAALRDPPPRLLVVVDEFHALRDQLPDTVDRLVRVASLGRSLGMHLIACTQNPMGQVGPDMKANMAIGICLRVRDAMQSVELLGDPSAAAISPSMPGAAFCADGERLTAWRCAAPARLDGLVDAIARAADFLDLPAGRPLFTAPLPRAVRLGDVRSLAGPGDGRGVPFALEDDGVGIHVATLPLGRGNVGVFGQHGRGRTTLLRTLARQLERVPTADVRVLRGDAPDAAWDVGGTGGAAGGAGRVWLVDDADRLLDPLSADPAADALREAIADPGTTVVFAAESSRHVRVPEQCPFRVVFPTGDRAHDLMAGVPAPLWGSFAPTDFDLPGRAVFVTRSGAAAVQCATADGPES